MGRRRNAFGDGAAWIPIHYNVFCLKLTGRAAFSPGFDGSPCLTALEQKGNNAPCIDREALSKWCPIC